MKALTDKIIENLQFKHDGFIGNRKDQITSANAEGFKQGLAWAIDSIKTEESQAEFEEIARILMKHLGTPAKYHPHYTAIVTNVTAELVEGECSVGHVMDYVPD